MNKSLPILKKIILREKPLNTGTLVKYICTCKVK